MEAAASLRRVLEALAAEDDASIDSSVRRRLEGAVIALDLAGGQSPTLPDHSA